MGRGLSFCLFCLFVCFLSFFFPFFFFSSNKCIVPLGFLPREIRVAFCGESQLRQSRTTQPTVHARCCAVLPQSDELLTGTTGSLTCALMLMHAIAHGGAQTP